MLFRRSQSWFKACFGSVPIQALLVVPFLFQVLGIVGLVAYFSYRSGQQALEGVAFSLTEEVSERIGDRLDDLFDTSQELLTLNQFNMEHGKLDPQDTEQLATQFWQQLYLFDEPTALSFTRSTGEYLSVGRDPTGLIGPAQSFIRSDMPGADSQTQLYALLDAQGSPGQQLTIVPAWDPRETQAYHRAVQQNGPIWTPLTPWVHMPIASIDVTTPIYQNGQLQGVLGAHVLLSEVSAFLGQIDFSQKGQVFIMDRSGRLVASSTGESPFIQDASGQWAGRLPATASTSPLTQDAARQVLRQWDSLHRIQQIEHAQILHDHPGLGFPLWPAHYFLEVMPYQDAPGLDWLVVVVIPASEFMPAMQENIRQTVIWSGLTLLGAIALAVYTTRWIARPILGLRDSANHLAQGHYTIEIPSTPISELRQLAFAFRQMAGQLQLSVDEMQELNTDLVNSRTQLETFLHAVPVGINIHAPDGSLTYMNQAAKRLLGTQPIPGVVATQMSEAYHIYLAGTDEPYPVEKLPSTRALQGEYSIVNDMEIQRGEIRLTLEVRATPIFSETGGITHAIVAFQDVTARKDAERILENYNRHLEKQVQQRTFSLEREIAERQQIEQALRESEKTQRAILRTIPDLLLRLKADGAYVDRLSSGTIKMYSGNQDITGRNIRDFLPPDLVEKRMYYIQRALQTEEIQVYEHQVMIQGQVRDEESRIVKMTEDEVLVIVRDISDRKQAEAALQQSEAINQAILTAIPDLMFQLTRDGIYLSYIRTHTVADVVPLSLNPIGKCLVDCIPAELAVRELAALQQALDTGALQVYEQEVWVDGQVHWEEVRVVPCGEDEVLFLVRDISDRKGIEAERQRAEEDLRRANLRLEELAQTDGLTQIANRRHFDKWLVQEWQEMGRLQQPLTLILFDVDHFKLYNDHYGHQAGDQCLIAIATAARQMVRQPEDLVARYGGEEFVIILPNTTSNTAVLVAQRLQQAIQTLAILHCMSSISPFVTISMGISTLVPSPHTGPHDLINRADQALYVAKQQGRDRYVLAQSIDAISNASPP